MQSGDSTFLGLDPTTGDVKLIAALDRETATSKSIVVLCTDNGVSPGKLTATATVSVLVDDVNDVTPVCSPAVYTKALAENSATGTNVATLACTDTDQV